MKPDFQHDATKTKSNQPFESEEVKERRTLRSIKRSKPPEKIVPSKLTPLKWKKKTRKDQGKNRIVKMIELNGRPDNKIKSSFRTFRTFYTNKIKECSKYKNMKKN